MDYKRLKKQTSAAKREKKLWVIVIILIAIIVIQFIAGFVLFVMLNDYKSKYESTLPQNSQTEIDNSTNTTDEDVGKNYSVDRKNKVEHTPPVVTQGGKELNNESSINN